MKKEILGTSNRFILSSIIAVGLLLIITGLLYSSFALQEPVKSISFTSEKLNYTEKEPGSFQVEKSAEWISRGKARITFQLDTILKMEGKNKDVIFVLDISGSMDGSKLARVKQDSVELINSLLSNSNNKAALITFDTGSQILSEFTNDKNLLLSAISNLTSGGTTNYYQALINVDNVLKNYMSSDDRDTIVLFLTDGYPCEDTPNEESYFSYLKSEYPYIVVNGIQYEMGQDILDPIRMVSDNQYLADMDTLNNVLFDASIVSIPYEKFVLTDYIDTDNFTLESSNDIKASQGNVEFNKAEQKVIWKIDSFKTGSKPKMTIDVVQKEKSKGKELVSTNKKETINSRIDSVEEDITSIKTPILKNKYKVIYDGNVPQGCIVSGLPASQDFYAFDIVEIENVKPVCEGYQFRNWKIVDNNIKRINNDYFEMPESDVIIRAEWNSLFLTKSMNGEVSIYIPPVLQKVGSRYYDSELWKYKNSITKIVFQSDFNDVLNATEVFDISEEKNGGVMGYLVPNVDDTSTYTVYIQGNGKIVANQDSSYLFSNFKNLTTIEGLEYLDTSKATNMYEMFQGCGSLTILDVSNFDTSNVKEMSRMFSGCGKLTGLNISNFDTSNVTNMTYMFGECSSLTSLDVTNFVTSKVVFINGIFSRCKSLTSLDLSNFDTSNVINMSSMFYWCENLISLNLGTFDTSNVANMNCMFFFCSSLLNLDLSSFNTSKVTDMEYMFYVCESLVDLDLSNFDTSKVTTMNSMFSSCRKLTNLDISSFNTSNVTNMESMFSGCHGLTSLDLSNFDTSKVTSMKHMFYGDAYLISLDLSSFDTSNVTKMGYMFNDCKKLTTTINIYSTNMDPYDSYTAVFYDAATQSGAQITVNYITENSSLVDQIIATKSSNSNVVKGQLLGNSITIVGNDDIVANTPKSFPDRTITLSSISGINKVSSFKMNGTLISGESFIMPNEDVIVSEIELYPLYDITIVGNDDIQAIPSKSFVDKQIILSSISDKYIVTSFKMNGTLMDENKFIMPDRNVVITDIEVIEGAIIESEHNPYPGSLADRTYGEKTFEGATSLTVVLDYQTTITSYEWIYLYDSSGTQYGKYGGTIRKTETITIPGNYIKIVFRTNGSGNYYGFKATIVPNYD